MHPYRGNLIASLFRITAQDRELKDLRTELEVLRNTSTYIAEFQAVRKEAFIDGAIAVIQVLGVLAFTAVYVFALLRLAGY